MAPSFFYKKKTKIVVTIGPATESPFILEKLIRAGMNVARINMTHGSHVENGSRIQTIHKVSQKLNIPVAILLDLSGPKIRTGSYKTDRIFIKAGNTIILSTKPLIGDAKKISISYLKLPQEVKRGSIIMLDDGKKKLQVLSVSQDAINCKVIVGGELKPHRGINVPGAYLSIPSITKKDIKDLYFGLSEGIDMVALSFVRQAEDVKQLKRILKKRGAKNMPVIAKIETQESIDHLDSIIKASDGIMVARGDLAIEVPAERVPLYQKEIISKCRLQGKPVITATQMLESMILNPVPTRAEISDIANAIFDGTDAVMLSEESALGKFALESVMTMTRIALTTEGSLIQKRMSSSTVVDAVSLSVCDVAQATGASVIVVFTESGVTARMVARFKPTCPIIALTPHDETVKSLSLVSGVYPYKIKKLSSLDQGLKLIPKFLTEKKLAHTGDTVVVAAGMQFGISGGTNMLFSVVI